MRHAMTATVLLGTLLASGAARAAAEAPAPFTDAEYAFYHKDKGTHYAQARYLCYWLQEKGLLVKFYHAFVAGHADDPTGYKTLQEVLGEADMAAFQKRWETFVLGLKFP